MTNYILRYNLKFFDAGEKTEQPTARKKQKAREEGQVAKSSEVGTAFLFLAVFFGLRSFAPWMYSKISDLFYFSFVQIGDINSIFTDNYIQRYVVFAFGQIVLISSPIFVMAMSVGIITNLAQVGWHPTTKPMQPKFSKLNPISGLKRLVSMRVFLELIKSLFKFGIIGMVLYAAIIDEIDKIPLLLDMELMQALQYIGNVCVDLGITVGVWFLLVAGADLFYQRYKHNKDLKMTKQEIKEEYKMSEGNPQIKGKIRQKMREASMRRMMQEVPGADVIITNPTHYAIAIRYDRDVSGAPVVIAKGMDFLAQKIKEKAVESNVEIVENKQVARALYSMVEIGHEIPLELYQAVAEILAFVYRIKNKQ